MTLPTPSIIWTIAGSDSSGGAGIQADIKTAHALGVHIATVITAITAQNTRQVTHIAITPSDSFVSQLNALKTDILPGAIKIGLLASVTQIEALVELFETLQRQGLPQPFVILDPVQVASTGCKMSGDDVTQAIKQRLLPWIDLLTPNLPELATLSDMPCADLASQALAVKNLMSCGCKALLVKGGHDKRGHSNYCCDRYYAATENFTLASIRHYHHHTHGTGCTLSTAIAAAMAKGYLLADALVIAKAYLNQALRLCYPLGNGKGPVGHGDWPQNSADFPRIEALNWLAEPPNQLAKPLSFAPCKKNLLGLYPVVPNLLWLQRLLELGVKTVQLRLKDPEQNPLSLESQIKQAIELGRAYQAQVFINDYWQLAIKHQAFGVHLGQQDIETADLASISQAGLCLGLSTHGYYELLRAKQLAPSYIALGHIFPTQTKVMPSAPQGVRNLRYYHQLCQGTPTVAIGGISLDKVEAVMASQVDGIAMVSAIIQAKDWQKVTLDLLHKLGFTSCATEQREYQDA